MARTKGFLHAIAQAHREAERRRQAQLRAQLQTAQAATRARRERLRELDQLARIAERREAQTRREEKRLAIETRRQQQVASQAEKELERLQAQERKEQERLQAQERKEQERLYVEERIAEAELCNQELEREVTRLNSLLNETLAVDDVLDFGSLLAQPAIPPFDPGSDDVIGPVPTLEQFLPPPLTTLQKLLPGATGRYTRQTEEAREKFNQASAIYTERQQRREARLVQARDEHARRTALLLAEAEAKNAEVAAFQRNYIAAVPRAIVEYCQLVLEASRYPEPFPRHYRLAYVPESKQLVVEAELPAIDVIPTAASHKYVKARDEITATSRPATQRNALYSLVIAQIAVRTLHELFEADRPSHVDTIVYNGIVNTIDRSTGQLASTCLVTVRTSRDTFGRLNLAAVDPIACLRGLNASVSKNPAELAPVRPVLEFNMVDPRFIEETDVLSTLDQRPNLLELSPTEFEALISNLFRIMGLETRLTQASRDGGVDCVAFDPRPIFGGKVVIQAKRYKNTVGVSAVRDLFGTVQNEGASKGILVTTSGFGKAAFEFAQGKPLELLSGSHLLHLLAEHSGIEAKIVAPDGWRDPEADRGGEEVYREYSGDPV